jgi:hypothetical protein
MDRAAKKEVPANQTRRGNGMAGMIDEQDAYRF